jgi:hypothetical protein
LVQAPIVAISPPLRWGRGAPLRRHPERLPEWLVGVVVVCGLLVLVGLAAIVRWGGLEPKPPWPTRDPSETLPPAIVARRYVWYVTVAAVSGLASGILLAGAGGRLTMRLLAATAGNAAQGRITEAEEVVGKITIGGTIGFIVFTGLFFGLATGALYLVIRRWLPRGRLGGLAFGGVLLVVAATRIEPLRKDNPDFDIVGPGWVSIVVFAAVVVAHGMCVAAVAGRYSRVLPLLSRRMPSVLAHGPLLLLAPVAAVFVPVTLVGVVTVLAARLRPVIATVQSGRFTMIGRVLLVAIVLVAIPSFVSTVADILGRGP